MARGTQLTKMVDMLRFEMGQSIDRAAGVQSIDHLKYALERTQTLLYDEHDWPFLNINRTIDLVPNARFYSLPAEFTAEMVNRAWVEWGSEWLPVQFGIQPEHYNAYYEGQPTDPVQRWAYHDEGMIEVWPMPASPGKMRFYGTARLAPLTAENDRCTLDDLLIVLFAAADLIDDEARASKKLGLANSRLRRLKGNLSAAKRQTPASMLGTGSTVKTPRPGLDYIPG